jgi:hypothetical protein
VCRTGEEMVNDAVTPAIGCRCLLSLYPEPEALPEYAQDESALIVELRTVRVRGFTQRGKHVS